MTIELRTPTKSLTCKLNHTAMTGGRCVVECRDEEGRLLTRQDGHSVGDAMWECIRDLRLDGWNVVVDLEPLYNGRG